MSIQLVHVHILLLGLHACFGLHARFCICTLPDFHTCTRSNPTSIAYMKVYQFIYLGKLHINNKHRMRTKGNCTTKRQSGAKLFSPALTGVRKRRRSAQMPATQAVPHAGHLYTAHDMDTSAAAGWLEARGGPDPARGRSDSSAWRGRCGGARGIEGGGGWRQNAEVGLWTRSGGATERPGSHHDSHESEMGLAMLGGHQPTSCFSADDP